MSIPTTRPPSASGTSGPVRVVSARGTMTPLARITDEVPPGTVYAPYFVGSMIPDFLIPHADAVEYGEDAVISVRLEKV